MTHAIYNEIEPFACDWLEALIARGAIAPGVVDRRSIADLKPADVAGPGQRHFFAGIGVWSYALRLARVPDDVSVWTGSCPCQPFSAAGKRRGTDDERHLWPTWFGLIRECRPALIFGEQVASPDGLAWLDVVCADLEGAGYSVGAADLCAAGVGAPHIRQRLFFVAYASEGSAINPRRTMLTGHSGTTLTDAARLASWPTCLARDATGPKLGANAQGSPGLGQTAAMAHWPTPLESNHRPGHINHIDGRRSNLMDTAQLAGWATPVRSARTTNGGRTHRGSCTRFDSRSNPMRESRIHIEAQKLEQELEEAAERLEAACLHIVELATVRIWRAEYRDDRRPELGVFVDLGGEG